MKVERRNPTAKLTQALSKPETLTLLATLLATAVIFWFILHPSLKNQLYLADDLGSFTIPVRHLYAQGLRADRIDIWDPALFYGLYAHAEGQMGMFHPFNLLVYKYVPFVQAFGLGLLTNYAVLWLGSYLLFFRWTRDRVAAAFGAFVFTFAGSNATAIVHVNRMAVVAHIPWALFALDGCIRGDRRHATYWRAALALINGSALLLGHPFSFALSLVFQVWYGTYLAWDGASVSRLLKAACASATGLFVGAIQLLPTWNFLRASSRAHPTPDFLSLGSLHPLNLFQLVSPLLFKKRALGTWGLQELSIYAGIGPLLLFLWLMTRKRSQQPRLNIFLFVLAVAGLFLSLGRYNEAFYLYSRLPGFNIFRMPCRFDLFTIFAIAGGSALALQHLRTDPAPSTSRRFDRIALGLLFFSFLTLVLKNLHISLLSRYAADIGSQARVLFGCALLLTGLVLFRCALRYRGWWLTAFCVFALCDLSLCTVSYLHGLPVGDMSYYKSSKVPVPAPAMLASDQNLLVLEDYHLISGYTGLQPPVLHSFSDPLYLQALGVTAVQDKHDADKWSVLPLPSTPLVRFEEPRYSAHPLEAMNDVDLTRVALVASPIVVDPSATGSVRILDQHPGFVRLAAESSGRAFCVLVQRFHPGWTATLDGKSLDLVPVDGDLTGFVVPGGRHEITLAFHPTDLALGRDITLITLLLLLAIVIAQWTSNHRRSATKTLPANTPSTV